MSETLGIPPSPALLQVPPRDLFHKIPDPWRERLTFLGNAAADLRFPAAAVGGCVRDLLLGFPVKDWDVVVEGRAGEVVRLAAKAYSTRVVEHPRFMTYTLHFSDGTHLDVATSRAESYPKPGGLPVVHAAPLSEDALRRDFSSNALYLRLFPDAGAVLDPTGGLDDMRAGLLRVLHDRSFVDDPTRLYRAARYSARYGWAMEGKTLAFIAQAVAEARPRSVSLVRLRHELFHLLEEENPLPGLRIAWEWGLWKYWDERLRFTEVLAKDLQAASRESPPLKRLAAFLKAQTFSAETLLKRFSTPVGWRKAVVAHLSEGTGFRK